MARSHLSATLVAGLLAWLPLGITIAVLAWLLGAMDGLFSVALGVADAVLPASVHGFTHAAPRARPERARCWRGCSCSWACRTNIFGQWVLHRWDALLSRIPIVRSIYSSVKQVSDTVFSPSGQAFREAVLGAVPAPGLPGPSAS
jgi:uncharacterized membrane protein